MFNSAIMDIAVSLSFTYLFIAILISSINEWLQSAIWNSRGETLKNTIQNLLFDERWKLIAGKIFDNPFIQSLKKKEENFPSYIPARNFSLSLLGIIRESGKDTEAAVEAFNASQIRKILKENELITGETKTILINLLDRAEDSYEKFLAGLEQFYNDAMDRASGWYKKKIKKILFALALLSSILLNIDSINIAKTLWDYPLIAKQAADFASSNISLIDTTGGKFIITDSKFDETDNISSDSLKEANDHLKPAQNILKTKSLLDSFPIPIGWTDGNFPSISQGFDFIPWISKAIGWLITALAASLGAPFWFDLMNKFVNLRGTGKKPEKSE